MWIGCQKPVSWLFLTGGLSLIFQLCQFFTRAVRSLDTYTQRRPGRESKRAVLARDELKSVMLAEVLTQTGPTGLWTMNYSLGLLSP